MVLAAARPRLAPIIASAGIVGVALGFGAQNLVKDFLTGIFMILEDQYGVGDVVDLGEATGTVEAVGLRVTRLRDVNGTVWYVRNGEIMRVGNQSQNWARAVLDVTVGYDADLDKVQKILQEEATAMFEDERFHDVIIEAPEVWGVERFDKDGAVVRVVLKTAPLEQWEVAARHASAHQGPLRRRRHHASRPPSVGPAQRFGEVPDDASVTRTERRLLRGHRRARHDQADRRHFYEGVETDQVLRPLYPEEDLGPADERFRMFLEQYWGGPTTYTDIAATRGCACGTRRSR